MRAVPAADERDDSPPAGRPQNQARRRFRGIRTGQPKPDLLLEIAGDERDELFGQIDCRQIGTGEQPAEGGSFDLALDRLTDALVDIQMSFVAEVARSFASFQLTRILPLG